MRAHMVQHKRTDGVLNVGPSPPEHRLKASKSLGLRILPNGLAGCQQACHPLDHGKGHESAGSPGCGPVASSPTAPSRPVAAPTRSYPGCHSWRRVEHNTHASAAPHLDHEETATREMIGPAQ